MVMPVMPVMAVPVVTVVVVMVTVYRRGVDTDTYCRRGVVRPIVRIRDRDAAPQSHDRKRSDD